jgi:hypothetical protein
MRCKHDEDDMCKNCCHLDHFEGDDDCIICSYEDFGGNWKRWVVCLFLRHRWYGIYSWIMKCDRCQRERYRKGISFTPVGDGFAI